MPTNRLNIAVLGVLILLLFSSTVPIARAEAVKELTLGISKDENALNPYTYVTGTPGLDLVSLVYDSLFVLDKNNKPIPWLVKDYQISDDGKQIKMTLHDNVKWHDGQALTSEDVKFTYEYLIEHPKSRFTQPSKAIASIETPDVNTVIMALTQPQPDFLIQPLADMPILPKHLWSQITDPDKSTEQLGSGPFIVEEYKQGEYYKLKANPNYFKGKPSIESLVLPIIKDQTALFTALKSGDLDAVSRPIAPELTAEFENSPSIKLVQGTGYSTTLLQFNSEKYPFTEKSVREAISLAIDPQMFVDTLLLGYGDLGTPGFIHPKSPYFNSKVVHITDRDKAKELLEQSGFKDSNSDGMRETPEGNKLELTILVYSDDPTRIRAAELVTEGMKKIGLPVTVKAMDADTVDSLVWPELDVTKGRNYDMAIWSWSSSLQLFPARLVDLFYSDLNIGNTNIGAFKSKEFDSLADQLKATYDVEERQQIINKMQEQIAAEYPIVPLYSDEVINAYNSTTYDGWAFQDGKGIINKLSFVATGEANAPSSTEAAASSPASDKQPDEQAATVKTDTNKGTNSLLILGGILIVIAVGIYSIRRRNKSKK